MFSKILEILTCLFIIFRRKNSFISGVVIVTFFLIVIFGSLTKQFYLKRNLKFVKYNNKLLICLNYCHHYLNLLNIFNKTEEEYKIFNQRQEKSIVANKNVINATLLISVMIEIIFFAGVTSILYYSCRAVYSKIFLVGQISFFHIILHRIHHGIKDLLDDLKVVDLYAQVNTAIKKIFYKNIEKSTEYINRTSNYNNFMKSIKKNFEITIKNLTVLNEDNSEEYAISSQENIINIKELNIKMGDKYIIAGPSGCGKSSLAKVLIGLWDYDGEFFIGNNNIKNISLSSLRENVILISQENSLIPHSIADNIRYGNSQATQEEVEKAAKLSCIHEKIISLPNGYETIVNEALNLSGGERQRIALARLFVSKASIIVLDETTAALDVPTEMKIYKNIMQFAKNKTLIVIAHRMAILSFIDHVIFMENGTIVSYGQHKDLLKNCIEYKTFFDNR